MGFKEYIEKDWAQSDEGFSSQIWDLKGKKATATQGLEWVLAAKYGI